MLRNVLGRWAIAGRGVSNSVRPAAPCGLAGDGNGSTAYQCRSTSGGGAAGVEFDMAKWVAHSDETGHVLTSPFGEIRLPTERIDQFVWANMHKWHDKTAMVCGETDRTLTYAALRDHCAAFAVRLQRPEFGLKVHDCVAFVLPNSPDFAIATLGAMESGMVVTTVNPLYTADEIAKQLISSKAKLLVGTVEGYTILQEAVQKANLNIRIVCVQSRADQQVPKGAIKFSELSDPSGVNFGDLIQHQIDSGSLALLPYSSGTTGMPKGVMLSHSNIISNCLQIGAPMPTQPLVNETTADSQESCPSVLPFFHIYGFTVLLASKLALGCKVVTLTKFAPDTFMKSLIVHKGSLLSAVPPIINFMALHPSVDAKHLSSLRSTMSGAAPIGQTDVERYMKKITLHRPDHDFMQGYGMTETSPVCSMNIKHSLRYGSCGGPLPNTLIKIVDLNDPEMKGLPANQSGEYLVKGPQVMRGYLNNEAATKEVLTADGWLRTGDIAHFDDQGYIYVTDRLKELIKVKGFQVAPAELEAIIRTHPEVMDAAVIGTPDVQSGEAPLAFVVRKPGSNVSEDDVKAFVAGKVAKFKQLKGGVRFTDAIPKNTTGKILRRELKKML